MTEEKGIQLFDTWYKPLKNIILSDHFAFIGEYLNKRRKQINIFPEKDLIFEAFKKCKYDDVKVVILGQDPYFNKGLANGIAFSVPLGERIPPSLNNIYIELSKDLNLNPALGFSSDLSSWCSQGVLLLNTALTVEEDLPNSHSLLWRFFIKNVLDTLYDRPIVWILWGKEANNLANERLSIENHYTIRGAHPSSRSAYNFFGNKYFSKCNTYLEKENLLPINWNSIEL